MSRKYKFHNPEGIYFISFATVEWVDVFTKREYKDILIENLEYCQKEKDLYLYAWCIMSNHVHLIAKARDGFLLQDILRDFKKFTSKKMIEAIANNQQESRRIWLLELFKTAGEQNSNNTNYQFWRQDNKPIEVYSSAVIDQKLDYLHDNPVVEGIVDSPEQYLYSSARDYYGTGKGLLNVELLAW